MSFSKHVSLLVLSEEVRRVKQEMNTLQIKKLQCRKNCLLSNLQFGGNCLLSIEKSVFESGLIYSFQFQLFFIQGEKRKYRSNFRNLLRYKFVPVKSYTKRIIYIHHTSLTSQTLRTAKFVVFVCCLEYSWSSI